MSGPLLSVDGISRRFGGVAALTDVSFSIEPQEIRALIGPNGSGKSTTLNVLSGVDRGAQGSVTLMGEDISRLRPAARARRGIARTFQTIRVFEDLSVLENILAALHPHRGYSFLDLAVGAPRWRRGERTARIRAAGFLERVGIGEIAEHRAGSLPYGRLRLLELARAMAIDPRIVLLDEPAAGLNAKEADALQRLLLELRDEGMTLLVIEHNMRLVMGIADRITVLDFGRRIAEGTPAEIQSDPAVIRAYLGDDASGHDRVPATGGLLEDPVDDGLRTPLKTSTSGRAPVLLELSEVTLGYGEIVAVHDLSLTVGEGEIVTLVGSNGAGKTSTLSGIVGLIRPRAGTVRFRGDRIDRMAAERVARAGIALVPEGRRVFPGLTVRENLEVAGTAGRATRSTLRDLMRRVYELFPQLDARQKQRAWSLSGGEQQMLAIGRAIMAQPRLMLLDEPSLGLAPLLARDVMQRVTTFTRNVGLSVLLVEQNAALGFAVAERAYVLETGSLT